jgi:hypothetical protein
LTTFLSPCGVYRQTCSFFIITDYDVRFIVTDGSVGLLLRMALSVYCYGWLSVYCYGWLCRFALLDSTIWWLIFVNCFRDFGTWSFQCSVSDCTHISLHTHCHVALHTVLLPILCTLIHAPLSRRTVDKTCICCLFLFILYLLHDIRFVMLYLLLLLFALSFYFQISPRQSQGRVFFNNKLSIYTSNRPIVYCPCITWLSLY